MTLSIKDKKPQTRAYEADAEKTALDDEATRDAATRAAAELIAARNGWLARFVPVTEVTVESSKKVTRTTEVNAVTSAPRSTIVTESDS